MSTGIDLKPPTGPLKSMVFSLGAPRSGTTLLRVMLDGHSKLFSPPEMVLAQQETMAEREQALQVRFWDKGGLRLAIIGLTGCSIPEAKAAVDAMRDWSIPQVYGWLQEQLGERMLVDKDPRISLMPSVLERVERWFPDNRYVWILRHPASVLPSIENMPMAEVMLQGYSGNAGRIWHDAVKTVGDFLKGIPDDRKVIIKYEDLVTDPEPVMRAVCKTLGLPYEEAMIHPYEGDRMREGAKGARAIGDPNMSGRGRIQSELATKWHDNFDHRRVDDKTKALALGYGYDLEAISLPPVTKISDALGSLLDTVRNLDEGMQMPQPIDSVEGRRFLMRMLGASIATHTEYNDPDRPEFHHSESPHAKMFADCPDADYLRAAISTGDDRVYKLSGRIPNDTVYSGILYYGRGGRIGNRIRDFELDKDSEGRFTLFLSINEPSDLLAKTPHSRWLKADGDETAIMVRQYYTDRAAQQSLKIDIELIGDPGPLQPLDPFALTKGVERAERMLKVIFDRTIQGYKMAKGTALKRFLHMGAEQFFPTPDNDYQICWYRIGYNQLMLVRGRLPKTRYFSFTLYNAWMESFDYRHHSCHRNHTQIQTDADGNFEICLAHRDPGHPNWLDTAGHEAGYLVARSLLLEGEVEDFEIQTLYEREYKS